MSKETKIVHNPAPGVLLQITNPPSELAIGLSPRAIADIKQFDRGLKRARAQARNFILG
jgi:hypothetical protein